MKAVFTSILTLIASLSIAQVTQPTQPTSGPGGSNYTYGGVTEYDYATNGNGEDFWLFEPNNPVPDSANTIVFCHGMGETNPMLYGGYIKHLVRKGNIVIYPRYQKDLSAVTSNYNDSCAKGIQKALDTLKTAGHVKPRLYNYFITGHSVGGVLTANMSMLYAHYNLPKPLAAFSIEPGAPGLAGIVLSDYSAFPSDVNYLIEIGSQDIVVGTQPGTDLYNNTINAPTSHKNLVEQFPDSHGTPAITSTHMEPLSADNQFDNGETNLFISLSTPAVADAVDYFCIWKLMDALMDCSLTGQNCNVAFGNTPEQKSMGLWSDAIFVTPLQITPGEVGINEIGANEPGLVFPNPATNQFAVRVPDDYLNANLKFQLFDISGREIMEQPISNATTVIDKKYEGGVYFYHITGTNKPRLSGKIVFE